MSGSTCARRFQSCRGSAGSVAKIIGDYRTRHRCTRCQQGVGRWGQQPGILKQLLLCWSSALHLPTLSHADQCSRGPGSARGWRFAERNGENRGYACKRSPGNANRCEKCCKESVLPSSSPQVYRQVHCKHRTWSGG